MMQRKMSWDGSMFLRVGWQVVGIDTLGGSKGFFMCNFVILD
jgi:hypothetical protein